MLTRKIIIDGKVCFRPSDCTLWPLDTEDSTLPIGIIPSRVLDYLLTHAGRVISREELLAAVWTDFGLHPSGHSLNQNLSTLRKTLLKLGASEAVIITLPRYGYTVEESMVTVDDFDIAQLPTQDVQLETIHRRFNYLLWFSVILALTVFAWFGWKGILQTRNNVFDSLQLFPLMKLGECSIYTTRPGSEGNNKMWREIAVKLIDGRSCNKDTFYMLYLDDKVLMQHSKGRFFMARCEYVVNNTSKLSGCESVYESGYEKI